VPATQRRYDAADPPKQGAETVRRYDRAVLRAPRRTPEGFLLAEGFIAKPGVLVYRNADGSTRRELVLPEELHKPSSLATLGRKPMTLEHPPPEVERVDASNVQQYGVGDIDGDVDVTDDGYVRIKMCIRRKDAVEAVEAGKQELSAGYVCRIENTAGNHPEYGPYDCIQRDRDYNHGAITDVGRAGPSVKLRADSADAVLVEPLSPPSTTTRRADTARGVPMIHPKLLALLALCLPTVRRVDAEAALEKAPDEAKQLLGDMAEALSPVVAEHTQLKADKARADAARADSEKPEAKAAAEKQRLDSNLAFFDERLPLVRHAEQLRMDAAEVKKLDNAGLRKAIVLKVNPAARKDGTADYFQAAYDMLAATQRSDAATDEAPNAWGGIAVRTDGAGDGDGQGTDGKRDDSKKPAPDPWTRNLDDAFTSSRPARA
jgi:hypothetical protein